MNARLGSEVELPHPVLSKRKSRGQMSGFFLPASIATDLCLLQYKPPDPGYDSIHPSSSHASLCLFLSVAR